jgi:hypothetical protein
LQHFDDIARRQQCQARLMSHTLLGHEQHHHRDVVMPGPPAECLIVPEAALTLGILERALDPVSLTLHLPQMQDGCIGPGIGQGVFDRLL